MSKEGLDTSNVRKLFRHSSNYFVGQILLLVASFASFPLYTRLLSISDYGLFGLINTTVLLIVAFSKLGLQHSIVRFYPDFNSDSNLQSISEFYSTFYFSIIFLGGLSSLLLFIILRLIPITYIDENIRKLLSIASILILFHCSLQTFYQYFRAEQKPKTYVLLGIASRYGSLLFNIMFYFFFGRILYGIIVGSVIWEGILFIIVSYYLLKMRKIHVRFFSMNILRSALKYGVPLIGVEISHLILAFGDRYLIQYYLGPALLGIYSAGHGLATYAAESLTLPIRDAILPIYMDIYAKRGEEETKLFLKKSLRYFSLIAIPVTVGFIAVSSDLIVLLASNKYIQSSSIIPFIVVGFVIYGTYSFFGAGLFVHKKTITILVLIIASCFVNVGLNLTLIPKLKIIGAALSTLGAYTFYIITLIIFSFKKLKFQIDYKHIGLYLVISVIMYFAINQINIENLLIRLSSKIIIGVILYSLLILIFDREVRFEVLKFLEKKKSSTGNYS